MTPLAIDTAPKLKRYSIRNLMQFNAIFGNSSQMPAISRRFTKTTANSRKFQQDRGIAVADAQPIWRIGLASLDMPRFPFSGRGDEGTRGRGD